MIPIYFFRMIICVIDLCSFHTKYQFHFSNSIIFNFIIDLIKMEESSNPFITNSFLTTIPQHSQTSALIVSRQPIAQQVNDWYSSEAKIVQAKKQRQTNKKNRLKQIEQQFQLQRSKKQREIQQKLQGIQKNKTKNLHYIQDKFHKLSQKHNKILVKIQEENLKQLDKLYDSRKTFQIETARHSNKFIHTSKSSQGRNKSVKDYKMITIQQKAQYQLNQIDNRLQKAKTMYKERQSETVNRIRNHNIFDIYHAQARAKEHLQCYLKTNASKAISKLESAQFIKEKIEKSLQKKNQQKHKSQSTKLKRIQNNLMQLQEEQQHKFQELSKKLQKTNDTAGRDKNPRETLRQTKFVENLGQLEKQKILRADQIIKKHQQIALKNRLFKEKRQTLYQTLKVEPV